MKEILIFILCFIVFSAIVLAIIFHKTVSNLRKALERAAEERAARKQAEEDEYFRRTSTKNYHEEEEAPKFKDDYFKSADEGARRSAGQRQKSQAKE
jgi:predicted Holliday junction resolvase-like endonuclease